MITLRWDDVAVGDRLPDLELPITGKTLVMAAAGTRDYMPYHHNDLFSRGKGVKGAFVNTMFNQALFGRYVTDWTGPGGDLRSATLRMVDQLCAGETARVSGTVTEAWQADGEALVKVDLAIHNETGPTALSETVIALPSHEHGPAGLARLREAGPPAEPSDGMPEEARKQIGSTDERHSPYPVSEAQIGYWCEMVRDGNPLYRNGPEADASRYRGMVAPPTMLITWGMPRGSQIGVDWDRPDVDAPDQAPWPEPARLGFHMMSGMTDVIVQKLLAEFGVPVRVGDRIRVETTKLLDCSPLRQTKLGPGYFVTSKDEYRNGAGELVGRITWTVLEY